MRTIIGVVLVALLACAACKNDDSSNPAGSQTPLQISLSGFGTTLDSLYVKVWSDSSSERFGGDTVIGGTLYVYTVTDAGTREYYSIRGYAGWQPAGYEPILFDSAVASLPQNLTAGVVIERRTTFTAQDASYALDWKYTLVDTGTVALRFGTFHGCPHLSVNATISSGSQSQNSVGEDWLGKDIGTVKIIANQQTILMVHGVVNGRSWGMAFPGMAGLLRGGAFLMAVHSRPGANRPHAPWEGIPVPLIETSLYRQHM